MELGYARVSTAERDLQRQVEALTAAGVGVDRIFSDTKVGVSVDRPGWRAVRELAGPGDVVVVHTLDRLGRTTRDTLGLVQELTGRGVGLRSLADPVTVDSADPADPMGQLMVAVLVLLAQMDRTYTAERAAHARAVASRLGRQVGRPSLLDPARLALAVQLRERGHTMAQIVAKTGMTRSSLYRYLPPRPPAPLPPGAADRRRAGGAGGAHRDRSGCCGRGCFRWGCGGCGVSERGAVMGERVGVGERLVTVLLTLAVPQTADPEDAAALVADAAEGTALQVRHAVGVEGHLPTPGATVVRPGRRMPWQVVSVAVDTVRLRDLVGDVVEVSRRGVLPDPLELPAELAV